MSGMAEKNAAASLTKGAELRRDLGLIDAVGIGFGAVIGAGIFVVTGVAAGIAGPSLLLSLVIAGIAATCNALSSAQLAAEFPQAGGTYEYGYRLLGPRTGFAAGWLFLSSKIAAAGTVALGLGGYVGSIVPDVSPRIFAVVAVAAFTALNYFGVRRSSRANMVIVVISLASLIAFVLGSIGSVRMSHLTPFAPRGWRGILEAAAILFFAYTGYARIATIAEEVQNPRRTIPRAIIITVIGALVLYLAVAFAALGLAGAAELAGTTAPLQSAASASRHAWLPIAISVGGVTAMLGVIFSQVLGLSRMVFAMARRGDLPKGLARVHPKYSVPGRAVIAVGVIAGIVAAAGSLRTIASSAAFTILIYYGIANIAALRMRREAKLFPDIVPATGLIACAVLAISLPPSIIASGAALLIAGFAARYVIRRTEPVSDR
jgi:basic amino acid/polyamine antiporter, APA family